MMLLIAAATAAEEFVSDVSATEHCRHMQSLKVILLIKPCHLPYN